MGKKQKKAARQRRLQEARKPKPVKKDNKKRKFTPLRELPPIVFIRGDDYEPVKYGMADSRDIKAIDLTVEELIDMSESETEGFEEEVPELRSESEAAGVEFAAVEEELGEDVTVKFEEIKEISEVQVKLKLESDYEIEADGEYESDDEVPEIFAQEATQESAHDELETASTVKHKDLDPQVTTEHESDDELNSSDFDSDCSIMDFQQPLPDDLPDISSDEIDFSLCESNSDLDSDFYFTDDPYTSAFGPYEQASASASDEENPSDSMEKDIDYNDMDLKDLIKLGINIDDEYDDEYDLYANSDADDVITGLLAGNSLDDFSRPQKKPRKQSKQPITKRRKARLEAREQARATAFGKQPPLWTKYPDQLTVRDVVEEIQALVFTPNIQELRFPPLDHNANWYVGEFAKLHGLKVKSFTGGKHHCVVILKTSKAHAPEGSERAKLGSLMHRRQTFRRIDTETVPGPKNIKTKSTRPQEGQIVGHNAEAVSDGFGHKLMQSMGWSAGTGLGSQRDGIQVPLAAKIKLSKRGLEEPRGEDKLKNGVKSKQK